MLKNYNFRMTVKEYVAKVYDTFLYAKLHPLSTLKIKAHNNTIEFIENNCIGAVGCRTAKRVLSVSMRQVDVEGLYLEFGVYTGGSIKQIAKEKENETIHGFDSFVGLPGKWGHYDKNDFSLDGKPPKVPNNVILHKGFFEDVLPQWTQKNKGKIALLHVDCDLYESVYTVFEYLWDRLQVGSVIVFDDYFNFPCWENYSHRALHDFLEKKPIDFEYLAYGYKELSIIVTNI